MISLNVMVVDDSAITVKKMVSLLEKLGHSIAATCDTGIEAVHSYSKYKPDLITMDITMPDMDGIAATEKIIEKYPEALILIVTSHGQKQMVLNAIKAGAKGYLLKPIQEESLVEALEKIINNYV